MSKTSEIFIQKGVVKNRSSKALKIYSEICPDFTIYKDEKPSCCIEKIWRLYQGFGITENSINGKIFEYILSSLLINENLLPFYVQAKIAFVPNADYDFLLYCKEKGPIVLSAKTSLRERYKQADLEAVALKYVYRKSESYLITIDQKEASSIQAKVISGDVIGIDRVIYVLTDEFDDFINYLKKHKFEQAGSVNIVQAGSIIY